MSGLFKSTGMLTNEGIENLDIHEYLNSVIEDLVIHVIPLSTSTSISNLRIIGGFAKTFIPSIYHPSLTHIAIQLNLKDCKDVFIIEYGQYLTQNSGRNKSIFDNFSSSKETRTSNNDNFYYYINKDGARITRFEDNYLKNYNETNVPKLITNLIACQHYQISYSELLSKNDKDEFRFEEMYNNFYRVECYVKNKIKFKELIEYFEKKKMGS